MIEKMILNMIPLLLAKVRQIPQSEKQTFAFVMGDLCNAYAMGDRLAFDNYLEDTSLSPEIKTQIKDVLWNEDQT